MRISPCSVLNIPSPCSTQMVGTTAGGMISPARTRKLITPVQNDGRRCSTNPTMAARITSSVTLTTVSTVLLKNAVSSM